MVIQEHTKLIQKSSVHKVHGLEAFASEKFQRAGYFILCGKKKDFFFLLHFGQSGTTPSCSSCASYPFRDVETCSPVTPRPRRSI